jgi:RNA 2',3'-cyclic 3'-phosphodiesterase
VAGGERIRLFCALQLPPASVAELTAWQHAHLHAVAAGGGRLVPPGNLHVTLAFLGSRPASEVPAIAAALAEAATVAAPIELRPRGYRETGSRNAGGVGMIVCEDETGAAGSLAAALAGRLEALGVFRREARPWLPHVTVLRFRKRAGADPPVTNIRSISVVRAALYASALRPAGAQYDVLETVPLGGR